MIGTDSGRLTHAMKREKKGEDGSLSFLNDCKVCPDEPAVWDDMMPRRMDIPMFPGVFISTEDDA